MQFIRQRSDPTLEQINKQHLIYHFRVQQQLQQQQQQQQLQLQQQQTNQRFVLLMFHILMMENVMLTTIIKKDAMMGVIAAKKMSNAYQGMVLVIVLIQISSQLIAQPIQTPLYQTMT